MSMQAATLHVAANPMPAIRDDWVDDEAYRELFVSVIELAIKDFEFLQRIRRQQTLTPSERKKLREFPGLHPGGVNDSVPLMVAPRVHSTEHVAIHENLSDG